MSRTRLTAVIALTLCLDAGITGIGIVGIGIVGVGIVGIGIADAASTASSGKAEKSSAAKESAAKGSSKKASPVEKEKKPLTKAQVMALAEEYIAGQGYTAEPATASKDKLARERTDGERSADAILASRRNTLQPKAVGARFDSGLWFVGFQTQSGARVRGLRMDAHGRDISVLSQSLQLEWLTGKDPEVKPLTGNEATGIAIRFLDLEKAENISRNASKAEDHKADEKDPADSWWVYFAKGEVGKWGKHKDFAIVSVDKMSREPKWISKGDLPPAEKESKKKSKESGKTRKKSKKR